MTKDKVEDLTEKLGTPRFPNMVRVTFRTETDNRKGFPIMVYSGSVTGTRHKRTYIIEEKNLKYLREAGLEFDIE